MLEKFKFWLLNDAVFYGLTIILVGICSFALGRASVSSNESKTSIEEGRESKSVLVRDNVLSSSTISEPEARVSAPLSGEYVASKSGTKYHLTSCPGAKQIKAENKITFLTASAAEAAGYKPAANCPGLQ